MSDDILDNVGGYIQLNNEQQTNTFHSNTHEYTQITQNQTSNSRSHATAFPEQQQQQQQRQRQRRSTLLSQEQASNFPNVLTPTPFPQSLHALSQEQPSNFSTVLSHTELQQDHLALRQRQQQQQQHFSTLLSTTEFTQGHHALRPQQQQLEQQVQQFQTNNNTLPPLTITPLPTPLPPSYPFSTPNEDGCNTGIQQQQQEASELPLFPSFFATIQPGVSNQQTLQDASAQSLRLHNNSEYEQQPINVSNQQMVQNTSYSPEQMNNNIDFGSLRTGVSTPQHFQRNVNTHMGFDNNKVDNNYPITPSEFNNNYQSPSTPNNQQLQQRASFTPNNLYTPQSQFTSVPPHAPMNNNNNHSPNIDVFTQQQSQQTSSDQQPSDTSVDSCRITAVLTGLTTYHEMKFVVFTQGGQKRKNLVANTHSRDDLCHDDGTNLFSLVKKENGNSASFRMNCSGGCHPDIEAAYPAIDLLFKDFDDHVSFSNIIDYLRRKHHKQEIPLTKKVKFVIGNSTALGVELGDMNILTSMNSKKIFMNGVVIPLLIHTDSGGRFGSIYHFQYQEGCGAHWEGPPGQVMKSIKDLMDSQVSPADRTKAIKVFRTGNFYKGTSL